MSHGESDGGTSYEAAGDLDDNPDGDPTLHSNEAIGHDGNKSFDGNRTLTPSEVTDRDSNERLDEERTLAVNEVTKHSSNRSLGHEPTRSERFHPEYEPFKDNYALQLNDGEVNGAVWFMNPTHATFTYLGGAGLVWAGDGLEQNVSRPEATQSAHHYRSDIEYKWTSRNNRKGRHQLVVHQSTELYDFPASSTGFASVLKGILRIGTVLSFSDISYLVATIFALAIAILLVNAILSIMPYAKPQWKSPPGIVYVEGALTLTGCTLFLLSSFLSFIEAVNANKRGCFGWKREHLSYRDTNDIDAEHGSTTRIVPDWDCIHKRNHYANLFQNAKATAGQPCANESCDQGECSDCDTQQWRWFPTNKDLREHFIYDLGFVTCSILLLSSTIYCSAGLATLISIVCTGGTIVHWIRYLQVVAGIGFTISSILFMLESQTSWIRPEIRALGWHLSFFNAIGSIGFTLCAIFALSSLQPNGEWAEYQFAYAYLWGSCGFLVGSVMQWYEALDKHPIERKKRG